MTRTTSYQVVDGRPVPDVSGLDGPSALARKREIERLMGVLKGDPARTAEREALKLEDAALARRLTDLREEQKRENSRRNFAGIGSPLHEAIVGRLDATTVAELEAEAMNRLAERERRSAEKKAAKAAKAAES